MDTKKKTLRASERDEEARSAFRERIRMLAQDDLVVVDEMGSSISLTRLYARSPKGRRAYGSVPRNHGTNTTLIGALTSSGVEIAMTLDGAVDTPAFELFTERFLCPILRPGRTVVAVVSAWRSGSSALPCHDETQIPIDLDDVARPDDLGRIPAARHSRESGLTRHDGSVRHRTSLVRNDAPDLVEVWNQVRQGKAGDQDLAGSEGIEPGAFANDVGNAGDAPARRCDPTAEVFPLHRPHHRRIPIAVE